MLSELAQVMTTTLSLILSMKLLSGLYFLLPTFIIAQRPLSSVFPCPISQLSTFFSPIDIDASPQFIQTNLA
jgi:hypothetical protein